MRSIIWNLRTVFYGDFGSVTEDAKKGVGVTRVIDYIGTTDYRNVMQ